MYAFKIYKIFNALSINNIKRPDCPGLFICTQIQYYSP